MMPTAPDNRPVQWPGDVYDPAEKDLSKPVREMLYGLRLLEHPDQEATGATLISGTPVSLQVLTSGATSMAKWWTGVIDLVGGGGTVLAAIDNWQADPANAGARSVAIAAVAALGAAVVLAIALIVRADVAGRATAASAEYAARAQVAVAVIDNARHGHPVPAPPAPEAHYRVQTDGQWVEVKGFKWVNNAIVAIRADDREPVSSTDIQSLMPYPPTSTAG
jgi:hypothetical protein